MKFRFHQASVGVYLAFLLAGCNEQKPVQAALPTPDPNVIETKLADGRVLHYTKQQLKEANSWSYSKDVYESALAQGHTHGELIETVKKHYWEEHGKGAPTPAGGITPPPEWNTN